MKHGGVSTYSIVQYRSYIIFPFMVPYPIIYMSVYTYPHHVLRTHMCLLIMMSTLYQATLYQYQDFYACNIS